MPTNGHKNGLNNILTLTPERTLPPVDPVEKTPANNPGPELGQNLKRSTRYLQHFLQLRQPPDFERQIVPQAGWQDLNKAAVARYLAEHGAGLPTASAKDALLTLGCLAESEPGQLCPTYAGLLLFGRSPEQFLPSAEITAVCYPGVQKGNAYTRRDLRGALPAQIQQAQQFVSENLRPAFYLDDLDWVEEPTLPPDAVREVIVNAVAHRDYAQRGESVRLLLFADRLECYSPGRLPGHITVDNLGFERCSRNELLARFLAEMGWMEKLGHGVARLAQRLAEEGLPPPEFAETAAGFKVTLCNRPALNGGAAGQTGRLREAAAHWQALGLYARQIKAMNFALDHNRITLPDYGQLCPNVSPRALERDLDGLVQRNLLLRVSEGSRTYYILK